MDTSPESWIDVTSPSPLPSLASSSYYSVITTMLFCCQLSHRTERYSSMNEDTTDHFIIGFSNPIISANEPVAVLGYRALHNDTGANVVPTKAWWWWLWWCCCY